MAITIQKVRAALTDRVMAEVFLPLKGNALGFLTDDKQYTVDQIRTALIEATLLGAMPINNEFNILSGRAYLTKNCCIRMVRQFPGLTNLVIKPNYPRTVGGGWVVDMSATFKLNGKAMTAERTGDQGIPVRANAGQGADAVLGKAYRKFHAYLLSILTGSDLPDGEIDDADLKDVDTVDLTSTGVSAESAPQQSASQTMAEKMKTARVTKSKITPAETPEMPADLPTPNAAQELEDAAVDNEPVADAAPAAQATPAPAQVSDASKKLLAFAEQTLKDAEAKGIKVGAAIPVIIEGKVVHRNLNADGTLKVVAAPAATPAASTTQPATAAAQPGVPTTGTPVSGKKRKVIGYVNGKPVYEDEQKKAATAATQPATPAAAAAPVTTTAAPATAAGKQGIPIVTPPPNATGEVEEAIASIDAVNNPKIKTEDGSERIRYRVVDENSAIYFCGSKPLAQKANELKEKKERATITYYKHGGDYWLQEIEKYVEPAPAQQDNLPPADGAITEDPFDTEVEGSEQASANSEL